MSKACVKIKNDSLVFISTALLLSQEQLNHCAQYEPEHVNPEQITVAIDGLNVQMYNRLCFKLRKLNTVGNM